MLSGTREVARRLIGLLDLTSLNDARDDDIATLCARATTPYGPVTAADAEKRP